MKRNRYTNIEAYLKEQKTFLADLAPNTLSDRLLVPQESFESQFNAALQSDIELNDSIQKGNKTISSYDAFIRDLFLRLCAPYSTEQAPVTLTSRSQVFNSHYMEMVQQIPAFYSLRASCISNVTRTMRALSLFCRQLEPYLDKLVSDSSGPRNYIAVLERKNTRYQELLRKLFELEQHQSINSTGIQQKKLLSFAGTTADCRDQVEWLKQEISNRQLLCRAEHSDILRRALETAYQALKEEDEILSAWGSEPGADGKVQLDQEKLSQIRSNEMLLEIAKYMGAFKRLLRIKRKNGYAYGRGERYSIVQGNNLSELLSGEFSLLAHPSLVPLFIRKYMNQTLLQHQKRERSAKGHGDMIICIDESSSTRGEKAAWAKAMALSLLEHASIQKNGAAIIHFSSSNNVCTNAFPKGVKHSWDDIVECAEHFWGGGTDFESPLREAVSLLQNQVLQKPDIIFITDGICRISDEFQKWLWQQKQIFRFSIVGVLLDKGGTSLEFSLQKFCDGTYRTSQMTGEQMIDRIF